MAKTFAERLAAAKTTLARLTDNEKLLTDLRAELTRLTEARDRSAVESVDYALSDADRDDAASKADRYQRTIQGLEAEIAGLIAIIDKQQDSASRRKRQEAVDAAFAERDELEAEWMGVPAIIEGLIALFQATADNAKRFADLGMNERNAEAEARGITFLGRGGEPEQFMKMKIPEWEGHGRAWPIERRVDPDIGRTHYLAQKKQMLEKEARWQRYTVRAPEKDEVSISTRIGARSLRAQSKAVFVMDANQVEKARKSGCQVEAYVDVGSTGQRTGTF